MTENNESQIRTWGMLAHLSSLVWIPLAFIGLSFPVLNILGPLIVWVAKKNEHPFIDANGKESLNFQLSFTLYNFIVALILVVVGVILGLTVLTTANRSSEGQTGSAGILGIGLVGVSVLLAVILAIFQLVVVILASLKAKNGEFYRYPLTIRFLR